jgi:hypothetical protein
VVFHWRLHTPRKGCFKVSHLCYAYNTQPQYEAVVKLLGSFRLTVGNRHLHRYCIFTERVLETVFHSLRHSCTSELTRQGITLYYSFNVGPYLHPRPRTRGATYGLSFESRIQFFFRRKEVAFYDASLSTLFTVSYNRPNPFRTRPKSDTEP